MMWDKLPACPCFQPELLDPSSNHVTQASACLELRLASPLLCLGRGDLGQAGSLVYINRLSGVLSKPDAMAFAPESNNYDGKREDDPSRDGHCTAVADSIAEFGLAISNRARQQHSTLVCESGQKAAD